MAGLWRPPVGQFVLAPRAAAAATVSAAMYDEAAPRETTDQLPTPSWITPVTAQPSFEAKRALPAPAVDLLFSADHDLLCPVRRAADAAASTAIQTIAQDDGSGTELGLAALGPHS